MTQRQKEIFFFLKADYMGCTSTNHFTTVYIIWYRRNVVCWTSIKQKINEISSTIAEFIAIEDIVKKKLCVVIIIN